jgi:hypothetical protein
MRSTSAHEIYLPAAARPRCATNSACFARSAPPRMKGRMQYEQNERRQITEAFRAIRMDLGEPEVLLYNAAVVPPHLAGRRDWRNGNRSAVL